MHLTGLVAAGLCATSALVSANPVQKRDVLEDVQKQAIAALQNATDNGLAKKSCNIFNAKIRKEW